ncbi:hypothetical protein FGF04_26580 [Streptomyces apricus]|uniref:Uncharacterized protein n=1 Tax=Streptomyces apricus TaxID=1828112 RepID=A0A5B0AK76_9ACTN|nr:hypothetical protein FGF04_26580 [Streptomyces apricus]
MRPQLPPARNGSRSVHEHVAGQRTLVTAVVPDEDPAREPTVCSTPNAGHTDVPYEVMRWFPYARRALRRAGRPRSPIDARSRARTSRRSLAVPSSAAWLYGPWHAAVLDP